MKTVPRDIQIETMFINPGDTVTVTYTDLRLQERYSKHGVSKSTQISFPVPLDDDRFDTVLDFLESMIADAERSGSGVPETIPSRL